MMGTRSGDLDPGLLVHILRTRGGGADELERLVTKEAGLYGVSGGTSDVTTLLHRRATDPRAARAVAMFCYQVRQAIGAFAATLGGLDSLVFTGGIGQHAAPVRAEVCAGLDHLGIRLDAPRNEASAATINAPDAPCAVHVTATNEALVVARHTRAVCKLV